MDVVSSQYQGQDHVPGFGGEGEQPAVGPVVQCPILEVSFVLPSTFPTQVAVGVGKLTQLWSVEEASAGH